MPQSKTIYDVRISDVSRLLPMRRTPDGRVKRVSACTVWRWARIGVKARNGVRIRLDHVREGGVLYTSQEAVKAFRRALAAADAEHFRDPTENMPTTKPRLSAARERAIAAARAEFETSND